MNLRDYQATATDSTCAALAASAGASTLGVAATGLGKTVVFAHVIKRRRHLGRSLVIAHREELIRQGAEKIEAVTGEHCDIEMADERADSHMFRRANVVVASKDTLHADRRRRFNPKDFATLITDEAHHATAKSYRDVFEYFRESNPDVAHFGVTATPDRSDEAALGRVYQSVAFEYDVRYGVDNGWLVPVWLRTVLVHDLDLSRVRTTAGDLNAADLAEMIEDDRVLYEIAEPAYQLCAGRRSLVFVPSVEAARRISQIFNAKREGCSEWVSGNTPKDERRHTLARFTRGEFSFLVNVGCFTEGFDEPGIEVVVMARPTKSRSLFAQMVGRGTRPLPGVVDGLATPAERRAAIARCAKQRIEVVDCVGNAGRHHLVCPVDILGGNYSDEVVSRARRIAAAAGGEGVDVLASFDLAKRQIAEERELAHRQAIEARARFTVGEADPFDVFALEPDREPAWHKGRKPTKPMLEYLARHGVGHPERLSFSKAGQLIGELKERLAKGRAGYREAAALYADGKPTDVPAANGGEYAGKLKALSDRFSQANLAPKEAAA